MLQNNAIAQNTGISPGTLDPNFGAGGRVTTDFFGDDDSINSIVVDAAGNIVVGGRAERGSDDDFALARYDRNGQLDTTFGSGGTVTTDFSGNNDSINSLVIDSAGRIVVAGRAERGGDSEFALARYTATGQLDRSFGNDGTITTDFDGRDDIGFGLTLDAAGNILVVGEIQTIGTDTDLAIARYTPDGDLDRSFGDNGKVTTEFFFLTDDTGYSIATDPVGNILVAGAAFNGFNSDFALARYTSNGTLDRNFGGDGTVTTDFFGNDDVAYDLAIDAEGKIVLGGKAFRNGDDDFAVARYTPDGRLDRDFSGDGKDGTDVGSFDSARSIALDVFGNILLGGSTGFLETDFALIRYQSNGRLDEDFGDDGIVKTEFDGDDEFGRSITTDALGNILLAGRAQIGSDDDFAIARYQAERPLPEGFDLASYLAANPDLIEAFGYNLDAAAQHYLQFGQAEGRPTTFEADDYIASHGDLISGFGYNLDLGARHFIEYGASEGRVRDHFNEVAYLNRYPDLQTAFGQNYDLATQHYINFGYAEGRIA